MLRRSDLRHWFAARQRRKQRPISPSAAQLETLETRSLLSAVWGDDQPPPSQPSNYFEIGQTTIVNGEIDLTIIPDAPHEHEHEHETVFETRVMAIGDTAGAIDLGDGSIGAVGNIPSGLYDSSNVPLNAAGLPLLSSLPGATMDLFIDFDGWESETPFDVDGDSATFNGEEQTRIFQTWQRVSAFFSAFDLNVTTVEPDLPNRPENYLLVGNSISGGYSYVQLNRDYPRGFNQSGDAPGRSSGILHEGGHNFGLRHQSLYDELGNETRDYSYGDSDLEVPLMGVDFGGRISRLYIGHTSNASDLQDDVAVIQSRIVEYVTNGGDGFRGDDHASDNGSATILIQQGLQQVGSGVIERRTDTDVFSFQADTATTNILVAPEQHSSVDLYIELFDSSGNMLSSSDGYELFEELSLDTVVGSTYFVHVASHGDYGEIGSYEVSVQPQLDSFQVTDLIDRPNYKNGELQTRRAEGLYDSATGTYTLRSAAGDIWGTNDDMALAHRTLVGDGTITARVLANDSTHAWSKAGITIRESLDRNAKHVSAFVTGNNGIAIQYRTNTGASSGSTTNGSGDLRGSYVRLSRAGDTFTGEWSSDGIAWTTVTTQTVAMSDEVLIGLSYTNRSTGSAGLATFDNMTVTGAEQATPNGLAAPTDLALAVAAQTTITATWNPVAGAVGYVLASSIDNYNWTTVAETNAADTTHTVTDLGGDLRYFFNVFAKDAANTLSAAGTVVATETRPGPVTDLRIGSLAADSVVLDWSEANGELGYRIERSTDDVTWTTVGEVGAQVPSFTDTSLHAETVYHYRVITVDAIGDAATSDGSSVSTRLGAVTDLTALNTGVHEVTVSWVDTNLTETGFLVERLHEVGDWVTVATAAAGASSFVDANVSEFGRYAYRVTPTHDSAPAESASLDHWVDGAIALFDFEGDGSAGGGDNIVDTGTADATQPIADTDVTRDVGRTGQGLQFDGTSSGISLDRTASIHGAIDFSIGAWIRTTGTSAAFLVGQRDSQWQGWQTLYEFKMQSSGKLEFRINNRHEGGNQFRVITSDVINDGEWHYVVAQREGRTGRIYIDGVESATAEGDIKWLNGDIATSIGFNLRDNNQYFDGDMDSVRIVDRALTRTEIADIIAEGNAAPTVMDDTAGTDEDVAVTISVLNNDLDSHSDDFAITQATDGTNGTANVQPDGTIIYTPAANFSGSDAFTYTVADSFGAEATAVVNVTVAPINDAPVTADVYVNLALTETTAAITALAAVYDPDGDDFSFTGITQPQHGTVEIANDGTMIYRATDTEFAGADSFTYTMMDEHNASSTGTVYLRTPDLIHRWTLNETAGTLADDVAVGDANGTLTNAPVWASGVGSGGLQFDGVDDSIETGTDLNAVLGGTASLAFWLKTTQTGTSNAWNSPGITGVEQAGGSNDIQWGWINGSGHVGVKNGSGSTANSAAPLNDDTWHHVVLTRDATTGELSVFVDGQLSNRVTGGTGVRTQAFSQIGTITDTGGTPRFFAGTLDDVQIYDRVLAASDVDDMYGASSNRAPTANTDTVTIQAGASLSIDVTHNDNDPDGDTVTVTAVTQPAHGTAVINADGTVQLTADATFSGNDAFTYTISDGQGRSAIAAVNVTVETKANLRGTAFDAISDHVLGGRTDVSFTVQNSGTTTAAAFDTHIVWSPNNILGDSDDVNVPGTKQTFADLAANASESRTISVQLDQPTLFAHASQATPADSSTGFVSTEVSYVFLVVDAANAVSETDETDNSGRGHLSDSDDITYFPWDKNGNGGVTPLEALDSIRNIGLDDAASDFDGTGVVTPLNALSILQRIGATRNLSVNETLKSAAVSGKSTSILQSLPETTPLSTIAAADETVYVEVKQSTTSLFSNEQSLSPTPSSPEINEAPSSELDEHFAELRGWLDVI